MPLLVCQCSKPQDARMQRKDRMPVSSTIVTEMPSTPRKYSMFPVEIGIQVYFSISWKPGTGEFGGALGVKRAATRIDAIIAPSEARTERPLVALFGAIVTSRAPMIGIQIVRDSRCSFIDCPRTSR